MQRHEGGYYIRLLARRPARHRRDHRAPAGRAEHLAGIDRAAPSRPRPHGGDDPNKRPAPVPVILITYATTEDAVRKALAAVKRDRVIAEQAASDPHREKPMMRCGAGEHSRGRRRWPSITVQPHQVLERILSLEIVRVTERAAVSAARLRGRGNEKAADQAAVDAMRRELNKLPIDGTVVIGEGERDEAPMLFIGEKVGTKNGPKVDIAVDPLEGTTLCAKNMPGAIATMAMAEGGTLLQRARRLHGQDRHRPRLSEGRGRSRRAGRGEHPQPRQGQGRQAVRASPR